MIDQSSNQFSKKFVPPASTHIAIIGLGYVGLPLAVEFAKKYPVKGFDIKQSRVDELNNAFDRTLETDSVVLSSVLTTNETGGKGLIFTSSVEDIASCNIYIIAVPTPTDQYNRPDLSLLVKASKSVGSVLKTGDVVIYESTVYPGATEDVCIPVLEQTSGLKFNNDFFAGYSPERINPGDKVHTLTNILKVTSGSTTEAADFIDELYRSIITAGTHKAPSIKVAEACKVIENSQRDINIAFVNELAKIFNMMNIDTHAVLEAAGTKWNFLNFKPGLVGGHCTGVDPYYLAQKAQEVGYHPEIILAGRRLNDGMGSYVALEVIKLMIKNDISVKYSNILVLGFTFKENCPDVRNTRVIDIVKVLSSFEAHCEIYDPWADPVEVKQEYGVDTIKDIYKLSGNYDAIVIAVGHQEFRELNYSKLKKNDLSVIYDIKGILEKDLVNGRL
ncbi:nucleotide sugar dehydrogenase [Mucilaginibacter lappiensis]|uniref:UDP-N-acetyl-D-galactosamine dehydrogenase n=1 Tax=Mucilaginibacter lappiensis TaxID=354630 RepID=A0A1N6NA39_9SPHI|nr:nucleotide sugar dehydrogenase [Mucilaginibacter lappiensis]MBB6108036.1 UDP-N-acetyl-D-galactosamine dehydrogenase [Mucilaginibacter lappiensis]MBB6127873.1 UDP-N-acetyl-D-galactosamine dehydrogenase [Mucilaginibacter lappiensis]SIP88944.1 UDP-N-acetyl-D-galactosamine dehydrogenase [Mucilaginibacter lappiensis]